MGGECKTRGLEWNAYPTTRDCSLPQRPPLPCRSLTGFLFGFGGCSPSLMWQLQNRRGGSASPCATSQTTFFRSFAFHKFDILFTTPIYSKHNAQKFMGMSNRERERESAFVQGA